MLVDYAVKINEVFGKQSCFMTGGLDSRLVFGSFNKAGGNFECMFGQSGSSQLGDRVLVEKLSSVYNKKLNILDWTNKEEDSLEKQLEVFKMVDFNNWIGGGYKPHILSFAECSKERPFYAFGYFCEAIRLRDWAENKGQYFSLYDYVDNYYINKKLSQVYPNYSSYRDYLVNEYKLQLNEIGINRDYDHISIDVFERFRWMMARFCDSRSEFMLNNFGYAFSILSIPKIHEAILSLPANVIRGGVFQVKVINALDSHLIRDFDVFSHLRPYKISKDFRKVRKFSMKNLADSVFKVVPLVKPLLTNFYRSKRYNVDIKREMNIKFLETINQQVPQFMDYKNYKGDLGRLKSIVVGLYSIYNYCCPIKVRTS